MQYFLANCLYGKILTIHSAKSVECYKWQIGEYFAKPNKRRMSEEGGGQKRLKLVKTW